MVNVENSPVRTSTLFPKHVTFIPLAVGTGKYRLNTQQGVSHKPLYSAYTCEISKFVKALILSFVVLKRHMHIFNYVCTVCAMF